ncbi:hypothetical protein AYJ54_39555 [Bradyrhizobium centrolobii]|uniref:Uncharacterized protein n=2 Tax=Bradyrhizobium centrolobii TaxID=1505087 RepID=A0A176Z6N7_9BRAD|nr:hypothetical protein AYJ54_39555 [Bradyrhizobium centrolobii]
MPTRAGPTIGVELTRLAAVMANAFLIVMSIWFGISILFVAVGLWVTGPEGWHVGAAAGQLSSAYVKSRLRRHA